MPKAPPISASTSDAIASENTAPQPAAEDPSAATANPGPLSGIIGAQIAAAAAAAPALAGPATGPALPGKTAARSARSATAPAVSDAASGASARTVSAGAANTLKEAASSPDSASENGSSAGPTPFSVFFSGAGSGAQSAASALPHLIAPAVNSGLRENHNFGTATASVAGATAGTQSNTGNNNVAQNSSLQNAKDSLAASDSTGLTAGQTARAELSVAANAPLSSSQSVAAAIPSAAPTGITVALGGQATASGDGLPKAEALPNSTPGNPASLAPGPPTPAAAPGPVQMAQMVSRAENSEMRIGMSTTAFGSVEVRTVVHASDVGMTIGSEKGDLRGLLANDLPAITNTLQQQNLRLTGVNFTQGFTSSNNSSGSGGDAQQRSFAPTRPIADPVLFEATVEDSPATLNAWGAGGRTGLSILA